MRNLFVVLGALLCPGTQAAADAPFLPFSNAVDHVVSMVAKDAGRKSGERVVTHHTGWSRIDEVENGRRTTDYFGHAGSIALAMARGNSGEYVHLSIFRELDKAGRKVLGSQQVQDR